MRARFGEEEIVDRGVDLDDCDIGAKAGLDGIEKRGVGCRIVKGLAARTKMYKELGEAMVKTRRRRKPPRLTRRPWI